METNHYLILFFSFLIFSQIPAQECFNETFSGKATYYEGIDGSASGNCSLPVAVGDYYHCAMNSIEYDNSNACGSCITVNGPKGDITLKVVDRCPECASGDIELTQQAFGEIANVIDGIVPVTWKYTTCQNNINKTIEIVFKEGSSMFWAGIQLRNSIHPIINLEYKDKKGNWVALSRQLYNFFTAPNGIPSPMSLRARSVLGEELRFENITLENFKKIDTGKQFPNLQDCSEDDATLSNEDFQVYTHNILTTNGIHLASVKTGNKFLNPNKITIYNFAGQKFATKLNTNNGNSISIHTQDLTSGIYILKVNEDYKKTIIKKIVIK